MRHVSPQLNQHRLHGEVALPLCQTWEFRWVDLAVSWVYAWEVDLGDELDGWWDIGVVWAAVEAQRVDAVLVCGLREILLVYAA